MKKYLFNIATEGKSIILTTMLFSILSLILYYIFNYDVFLMLFYFQTFFFLVCCFFFRDPIRIVSPSNKEQLISPADGRILYVKDFKDPDIGDSQKIAIFLSFFNVHRQWVPLNSEVIKTSYNPGKFFGAFMDKASDKNEQTSILFNSNNNIYRVKQIAGFVARRIVNHMNENLSVSQGDKLGFIKFGSRVEIIVPKNFEVNIKKGMKVKGCKTVLGKFKK